ncbi:phospholipase A-2-activating protein-like [Teleopsis dalmanni]|uniref:phospholipase A-2-activating protein-like n=1 Tax=Teleopsis dalmanni TaxID=139649 RepID=UPI0018CF14CB|nr:phospholipase A-2-activating protein-like [Teleopsis dalmanni]
MATASLDDYKLSCELHGHSMDVRSVAVTEDRPTGQIIISGSRDKTTKLWKHEEHGYTEMVTFQDHKSYVSCVHYLREDKWICTGSNDGTICIYKEDSYVPIITLKGHKGNVCAISSGVEAQSLITGSWDNTARIWKIDQLGGVTFIELIGHKAAVWAVIALPNINRFLTGSADKTILTWNNKGEKLRMLTGHTDCIRGLISLPNHFIVSAGNDSVIRVWNEDGDCVKELFGHTNYIYSVAQNTAIGGNIVVSSGEDSSLRMWDIKSGTELGSPILHPAESVWSVACLSNGDIITGCSDGVVRVFTKDPKRYASEDVLKAFDAAVNIRKAEINETVGGVKKSELPGPEALLSNGKQEGDNLMVRHPDGSVKCYKWELGTWKLVGDVMGASGGSQNTSGKVLHEGKEYDFVFSVDISDTQPEIKLPYNRGDDPWVSAQSFIHRHNLPQAYLDQVANFIITNSGSNATQSGSSGFQDPFTGGSRYVPGSSNANLQSGGNVDPFTGASSYSTTNASNKNNAEKHFPISQYISLNKCEPKKVLQKLKEFNSSLPTEHKVSETILESVNLIAESPKETDQNVIEALNILLQWPTDKIFPVLDLTRLAVQDERIFAILNDYGFLDKILPYLKSSAPNQLMILRCLANMMCHKSGRQQIEHHLYTLLSRIKEIKSGSSNLQIAISTFYLNLTVTQTNGLAKNEQCQFINEGLIEFFKWATDLEACYRGIQAIGNLITTPIGQQIVAVVISTDFLTDKIREFANAPKTGEYAKIHSAASALLASF